MRYELADDEWIAIKPMLPNKPRGVPRVNDRRVLNGIFWLLRSGAPWRDLPDKFGPYTTSRRNNLGVVGFRQYLRMRRRHLNYRSAVRAKLPQPPGDDKARCSTQSRVRTH
jgi:transposase